MTQQTETTQTNEASRADQQERVCIKATYSVEDNSLRIYPVDRFDEETLQEVKKHGFRWAPLQKLFVAKRWTPAREDLCLKLADEIEAESTTMLERAEAKAIRLRILAEKRASEATAFEQAAIDISHELSSGQPILQGHHSARKMEKNQARLENTRKKAEKRANAVPYWNWKSESVQRHANRKNDASVRVNRIKKLWKEMRDIQRGLNEAQKYLDLWTRAENNTDIEYLTNTGGATTAQYIALDKGEITHEDLKTSRIKYFTAYISSENLSRWITHILNRIGYEQNMLPATPFFSGTLTPVIIQGFARTMGADKPKAIKSDIGFTLESPVPLPLHINPQGGSLELSQDEWRNMMRDFGYAVVMKERKKTTSTKAKIPLINPSLEEVEKLMKLHNVRMRRHVAARNGTVAKVAEIAKCSQATYSKNSKGSYSPFETIEIDTQGKEVRTSWKNRERVKDSIPVARIRLYTGNSEFYKAKSLVHISDKPTKPLPLDWNAINDELKHQAADDIADEVAKRMKPFLPAA